MKYLLNGVCVIQAIHDSFVREEKLRYAKSIPVDGLCGLLVRIRRVADLEVPGLITGTTTFSE
jgi:hypothetical protein